MNTSTGEQLSRTLANMRFPLMVGVLLSHSYMEMVGCGVFDNAQSWNVAGSGVCRFLFDVCIYAMPHLVVPAFFLISGYLFFLKFGAPANPKAWSWEVWRSKMQSRLYTLVLPYLLWNIIPLIVGGIAFVVSHSDQTPVLAMREFLRGKGLDVLWTFYYGDGHINILGWSMPGSTAPYNYPLYYLRDLIGICVLTPIVWFVARWSKWIGLVIIALCCVFDLIPSLPGLRSSAVFFFTTGAYLSVWNYDFGTQFYRSRYLAFGVSTGIMLVVLLCGLPVWLNDMLSVVFTIFGVAAVAGISSSLARKNRSIVPMWVANSCFFFYVSHEGLYILQSVTRFLVNIFPRTSCWWLFAEYSVNIALTLIICIALYVALEHWAPYLSILWGKRHARSVV